MFLLFWTGVQLGKNRPAPLPTFHNMRVVHIPHYTGLVDPHHPAIRSLATRLKNPEAAYYFVRDRILFDPTAPAGHPAETIKEGYASCLGKATLLCSLYRAMGIPAQNVRVTTGEIFAEGVTASHAWIDLEIGGKCLQQDPTELLGLFRFADFPASGFTRAFVRQENFCFNDKGFAVVSQLNRFKDGFPPGMPPLSLED